MNNDQLAGKYTRLRTELAQAYEQPLSSPNRSGLIERLAAELMEIERRLAVLQRQESASRAVEAEGDNSSGLNGPLTQDSPRLAA